MIDQRNPRTRRPPALDRLIDRVPDLAPDHHWEGEFTGIAGSPKGSVIRIKARIAFHGPLLEGQGRCINWPASELAGQDGLSISGTVGAESLDFQLWFLAADLSRAAIRGCGVLGAQGHAMTGDWSIGCFNPDSCGCDGGSGTFHLRRVD